MKIRLPSERQFRRWLEKRGNKRAGARLMSGRCPLMTYMTDKYGEGHKFGTDGRQLLEGLEWRWTPLQPWARRFVVRVDDSGQPYSQISGTECLAIMDMD